MVITIDGPAGSGKSTVARLLAERLGIRFLDTGAMYRAVALAVLNSDISELDQPAVAALASRLMIRFQNGRLMLNGSDVTDGIRVPAVTAISSVVASYPEVRTRLVALQREIAREGSLVTEGRDQGTVVFPDAEYKFFVTAGLETRARRRQQELSTNGSQLDFAIVREQLRQRDERDELRAHAPMKPADNAVIIDTSEMSIAGVVNALGRMIEGRTERCE